MDRSLATSDTPAPRRPSLAALILLLLLTSISAAQAQIPPGGVPIPTQSDFGDSGDQFGSEIDVDGSWMVTTGFIDEATYVYERVGSSWTRRQRIVPPSLGQAGPRSLNLRGNRLLIGRGFGVGDETSGRVYIYERASLSEPFVLQATVQPLDPQAGDRFGYGLAQSDQRLMIGASGRTEGSNSQQGVVYVFIQQGGNWVQEQRIAQTDPTVGDRFGFALDFDGQDLLIGARLNRPDASARRGAVYVYRPSGGAFVQVQKLVHDSSTMGTQLGYNLVASLGRAAIVAPGTNQRALLIAERDGGGIWAFVQTITNNFLDGTGFLGVSPNYLDFEGDDLVISLFSTSPGGSGPAYSAIYRRSGGSFARTQTIARVDGLGRGASAVAVAQGQMLIPAPFEDANSNFEQGSIQVYANNSGLLTPVQKIWHGAGNRADFLGDNSAIDGDWALITAHGRDTPLGVDAGDAYFMRRTGVGQWEFVQSINPRPGDREPRGVALWGDLAFVGLPDNDNGGRVRVLQRQANNQWTDLCEYTAAAGSALGDAGMAVSATGLVARFRAASNGRPRLMHFALPLGMTCPAGVELPLPAGDQPEYGGHVSLSGNLLAADWDAGFTEGTPPATSRRQGASILEFNGSSWTIVQTLRGAIGVAVDNYREVDIEGNRLVISRRVPVGALDSRTDLELYARTSGDFLLQRTVQSSRLNSGFPGARLSGDSVLAADDTLGPSGALAVLEFATGNRLQDIVPPGVGVEDGGPRSLTARGGRAVMGWSEQERDFVNNAGFVYVLEGPAARGEAVLGGPWTLVPLDDTPRPPDIFQGNFELVP